MYFKKQESKKISNMKEVDMILFDYYNIEYLHCYEYIHDFISGIYFLRFRMEIINFQFFVT